MTRPRSSLVCTDLTRYYHCITRCVRQAFLLQEGKTDRKKWLEDRMKEVAEVYAVSVASYAILDNHFHVLLRLDVDIAAAWSDEEVIKRWATLHPPKVKRKPIPITDQWLAEEAKDKTKVDKYRQRLCDLGWFMKEVKEPLARLCNREDGTTGTFFEGRFKSIAVLDEQALLRTAIYIDLNPFAAGLASTPEQCVYTSLYARIQHARQRNQLEAVYLARFGGSAALEVSADTEEGLWLVPIEDRRHFGSRTEGLVSAFTLGNYLLLLDTMARTPRDTKAFLPAEVVDIFARLNFDQEFWSTPPTGDPSAKLVGCFYASSRAQLRMAAQRLSMHHCWNLSLKKNCPTRTTVDVTAC